MDSDQKSDNIVEGLKEILKLSLPHCDNGSPQETTFVEINRKAHEILTHYRRGTGKDL
jgi:hypothetical protein